MKNPRRQAAGRKGGIVTLQRYGHAHMSKIGRRGAEETHRRYRMTPAGTAGWALVDRETGEVIALIGTRPW